MLSRCNLEIDGQKIEVSQKCIKNWDEVECAYKRSDYGGVMRSFSSKFEFVGEAYDLLCRLYLKYGFRASATLSIETLTETWEWEERFSAPIDFSSITWDGYSVRVNCLDNSLAAMIKARKSTRFDFVVGKDIEIADKLLFDRVTMENSCAFAITGDGSDKVYGERVVIQETSGAGASVIKSLPTYIVGESETHSGNKIVPGDQSDSDGSYFIKAESDAGGIEITTMIATDGSSTPYACRVDEVNVFLCAKVPGGSWKIIATVFHYKRDDVGRKYLGLYSSIERLREKYPTAPGNSWALIGDSLGEVSAAYVMPVCSGCEAAWEKGNLKYNRHSSWCDTSIYRFNIQLPEMGAGTLLSLKYNCISSYPYPSSDSNISIWSDIRAKWQSRASAVSIDAIKPESVLKALAERISAGQINVLTSIDGQDPRLNNTYLLAAECIRAIPGATLRTSFNDYCGWMEAVFGYVYRIGPLVKSRYKSVSIFDLRINESAGEIIVNEMCPDASAAELCYLSNAGVFAVFNSDDGKSYSQWEADGHREGWTEYNMPNGTRARTDKVFVCASDGDAYFIAEDGKMCQYEGDPARCHLPSQEIIFEHRGKIFSSDKITRVMNVRDVKYSVNKDFVLSEIRTGYEKQDYDAESGRDEWNFSARYTTGIDCSEKKLELVSKYRSDCYGIEFTAQKRNKDSQDSESDDNVFFAHCKHCDINEGTSSDSRGEDDDNTVSRYLVIDRSVRIDGALSDSVFNGEYSPRMCVKANGGYLSAINQPLSLRLASFDGNASVSIDGERCDAEMSFESPLFTAGLLEFSTDGNGFDFDADTLYQVDFGGVTYLGFLSDAKIRYATNEAVKCSLIVKEVRV